MFFFTSEVDKGGLGGSTACLRAEVHKDGQKVKGEGMKWRAVWAGQGTTFVRCPLEPRDSRKKQKEGKVMEESGTEKGNRRIKAKDRE